ncbi:MAG: fibronectin type III domain-containing protein [Clostridia bacterium]|nr:fibronectin type III domain-containing protein [Clostridia bacterium]
MIKFFNKTFNKGFKRYIALICAVCLIAASIPLSLNIFAAEKLSRPDLTAGGNYTVLNANENASHTFGEPTGCVGIDENLPTLTADFSRIPTTAKGIVFYFDFSEVVDTGATAPSFEITFYNNDTPVWTINKFVGTTVQSYTNKSTKFNSYTAGDEAYTEEAYKAAALNNYVPYAPKAGTVGYVVIPISAAILRNAISGGVKWNNITEIRFKNTDSSLGKDFRGKTVHLRDLGYVINLNSFTANCKPVLDYAGVSDMISALPLPPTNEDGEAIASARAAYDKVFYKDKIDSSYLELVEKHYAAFSDYQGVIDAINAIGTVTENSFEAIYNAMDLYSLLGEEYRSSVTNYDVLQNALESYYEVATPEKTAELLDMIPSPATLESKQMVEIIRNIYNKFSVEEKIAFTEYDRLLQAEVDIEGLSSPVYYGDGNYVVINKNENANLYVGANNNYGMTSSLPTLVGDFSEIPDDVEAIAFHFDYTESVNTGAMRPWFRIQISDAYNNVWTVNNAKAYGVTADGYMDFSYGSTYDPWAGSKGYVVIPIEGKPEGFNISAITKISFPNIEWVFGKDFQKSNIHLRDLGYVKNIAEFRTSFIENMDFTAVLNGVKVFASFMSVDSKAKLDEFSQIYDRLLPSAKKMITNYNDFLQAQMDYINVVNVEGTIEKIDAIGTVTDASGDAIADAMYAYYLLDNNLKKEVTNYDTLVQAEKTFLELQTGDSVNALISSLSDEITKKDYAALVLARKAYNAIEATEREKVTLIDELKAKEAVLDSIVPLYFNSPGNYVVLSKNEQSNATYGGNPNDGGQFGSSLPSITGDCSLIPSTADALVFEYDFSDTKNEGSNFPGTWQHFRFCNGGTKIYEGLAHTFYATSPSGYIESNGSGTFRATVESKGYVVVPITEGMDLSKVNTISFQNAEWAFGSGFKGSTVHFRNLGYINDLELFKYAVHLKFLEGYFVEVQPEGELDINIDAVDGEQVTISWEEYDEAYNYAVSLYSPKTGLYHSGDYARKENQIILYDLQLGTEYIAQVAALDTEGKALAYSKTVKFTTLKENLPEYTKGILEADDITTLGFQVEGTNVTVYWENFDGAASFAMNLYTLNDDGTLSYVYTERKNADPMQVTFLLLDPQKTYVSQLIAYDVSDSIIFVYRAEKFTLQSNSTYTPSADDSENGDGLADTVIKQEYVTETVYETVYNTETVYNEVEGTGKWAKSYEWVLNMTAVYIYIAIGAGALLIIAGIVVFIVLKRKNKKSRQAKA